jgi:hypothetical protein
MYAFEPESTPKFAPSVDKTTVLRAFNSHFFDFVDDIIAILPENEDVLSARTSFDMVRRANPTSIIKVWFRHVYSPYKNVLDNNNLDFFLEKDYSADLSDVANSRRIMEIIDTLRQPIREMGDINRAHSMKYIQNLCRMSSAYVDLGGNI